MLTAIEALEAVYGQAPERAPREEIAFLNADYQAFVVPSSVVAGTAPRSVIRVTIDAVYVHGSRAAVRAGLWDKGRHLDRAALLKPRGHAASPERRQLRCRGV